MKPIGHSIIRLDETTSTNTLVMEREEYLENHGLVVTASHQTAGRGRIGRGWASIPGAQLQFSVVLHPPLTRDQVSLISLMTGLAVAEVLELNPGLHPLLKWPNDVMLNGKKVCGILLEMKLNSSGAPRLVVGIGINCLGKPDDFPPEIREIITTLEQETGGDVQMEKIFQNILGLMQSRFDSLIEGKKKEMLDDWTQRAELDGKQVRFNTPEGQMEGRTVGLTEEGFLLLETPDGRKHIQTSGEIQWLD